MWQRPTLAAADQRHLDEIALQDIAASVALGLD
jgi:hypothetical protein